MSPTTVRKLDRMVQPRELPNPYGYILNFTGLHV